MTTFERIGTTRVWAEAASPLEGFVAFYADAAPPATFLTLAEAWEQQIGWLVFLRQRPADLGAFALTLEASAIPPAGAHTGFAWADYRGSALAAWTLLPVGADLAVTTKTSFSFGRYGLTLPAGAPVALLGDGFTVTYPAQEGYPAAKPAKGLALPFSGASRFCFAGQGLLQDYSDDRTTGWDVALRYVTRDAVYRYPIFVTPEPTLHQLVDQRWDPLTLWWQPADALPARTELRFTGTAFHVQEPALRRAAPAPIASNFRTIYGETISLAPLPSRDARLVLQPAGSGAARSWYLVPAGGFAMSVAGTAARRRMLCGLIGTEVIEFAAGDVLTFHPGQPAYAAGGEVLLTKEEITAWVSVTPATPGTPAAYIAQPPQAPLFEPSASPSKAILSLYDAIARYLDANAPPFPAGTYAALRSGTRAQYEAFERNVLTPARRGALAAPPPESRELRAESHLTTTPQGFLTEVQGIRWKSVTLAKNKTTSGVTQALVLRDVTPELQSALQSPELFLVVTNPAKLGVFDNTISIEDWPFTIDVGSGRPPDYRNVLIFKFGPGTLRERAAEPETWTSPGVFNDDPLLVSDWIGAYIDEAEQQAEVNPRFLSFLEMVDSPRWNGILALRVTIKPSAFPNDIKGLLAGIELDRFVAHHFGVDVNRITSDNGLQMPAESSLFALVNYVDKNVPQGALQRRRAFVRVAGEDEEAEDFFFRVVTLQVVFRNSRIVDFNSRIVLTITRLFGEAAERAEEPVVEILRNTVELFGSYENQGGVPYYTFQGDQPFRFLLTRSPVLRYVEIVKSQFHTFEGESDSDVASRFTFWGYLNFRKHAKLDLFSFGAETDTPTTGLYFSDLRVDMSFSIVGDVPTPPRFVFDASRLAFDLSLSYVRAGSLFRGFPLHLGGMEVGAPKRTPTDAGYLPVIVPIEDLGFTAIDPAKWYGVVYAMNLGTMGALAETAGFSAGLLAAWTPGGDEPRAAVLIQLPGTAVGKKELGIQSVIKVVIGQVILGTEDDKPSAYILQLRNVALSFLGKKMPSGSAIDVALFADPEATEASTNIGWYGAYYVE